jgi:hypothetical protein
MLMCAPVVPFGPPAWLLKQMCSGLKSVGSEGLACDALCYSLCTAFHNVIVLWLDVVACDTLGYVVQNYKMILLI